MVRWADRAATASDQQFPDLFCNLVRWAIPHAPGLIAAVIAGPIVVTSDGLEGVFAFAVGAGLAWWLLVYASSLFDSHGRGWHDKAAGTVVVKEPEPQTRPGQPERTAGGSGSGASGGASPQDSRQEYGLVTDYYAPRRPPRPEADESEPA